jgi:beta-mannosidase
MVWRLNDAWPIVYYSVVDYYLEPKVAYHFLRRAFAPVLVCFERAPDGLAVWVVNDSAESVSGELAVRRMSLEGAVRGELGVEVALEAGGSRRCLDTVGLGRLAVRRELLHASFLGEEATYLLTGERHLHLPRARLEARTTAGGVELTTDTVARQVVLEAPGSTGIRFGDNYFDMAPGARRVVSVPAEPSEILVRAYNADEVRVRTRAG